MDTQALFSRRSILRASALVAAVPLLAACGANGTVSTSGSASASAPAATSSAATSSAAPTSSAAATSSAAPSSSAAASTTSSAAAAASTTASASSAASTTAAATSAASSSSASVAVISAAPGFTMVDPKNVKINGKLNILQSKDWSDIHNTFLHQQVTQYAKDQNWPLDLSYADAFTGGGDFFQKIAAGVASNNGPDMVWGNYSTFQYWYLKTIQPVDDVMAAAQKTFGNTTPNNPPGNQFDGHWWTVPYFNRSGGWWARKSWFDAAGIDVTKPMNFTDWVTACLKVSDASKRQWGWGITVNRSGDGTTNVQTPWFESGARLTDQTGQKAYFNSEESIGAFTWLKGIYSDPQNAKMLPPGVNAWDDMGNNNAWYAGTIGFTSNAGTIFATALKNEPKIGQDTVIVPQPAGATGSKQTLVGQTGTCSSFYLLQGAKNPDGAKAMIQYLLSKDIQTKLFETSQGYVYPAYDWGWDTAPVAGAPNGLTPIYKSQVYSQSQFAGWQPAPKPLLWVDAVGQQVIMTDTMAAILKGTSVKDAVNQGQTKIEALIKQYNGQ